MNRNIFEQLVVDARHLFDDPDMLSPPLPPNQHHVTIAPIKASSLQPPVTNNPKFKNYKCWSRMSSTIDTVPTQLVF